MLLFFYTGFFVPLAPPGEPLLQAHDEHKHPRHEQHPSGYGQDADRRQALKAGFDRHFVKPLGIEELDALLSELRAQAV